MVAVLLVSLRLGDANNPASPPLDVVVRRGEAVTVGPPRGVQLPVSEGGVAVIVACSFVGEAGVGVVARAVVVGEGGAGESGRRKGEAGESGRLKGEVRGEP